MSALERRAGAGPAAAFVAAAAMVVALAAAGCSRTNEPAGQHAEATGAQASPEEEASGEVHQTPAQPASPQQAPAQPASPQQAPAQPASPECARDADCATSTYPDPAAGCCAFSCTPSIVPVTEANRRRSAWEAKCQAVRCARPHCDQTAAPTPHCRAGRCTGAP